MLIISAFNACQVVQSRQQLSDWFFVISALNRLNLLRGVSWDAGLALAREDGVPPWT